MHSELYLTYNQLSQKEIDNSFIVACQAGNLSAVKYLLCSPELPQHAQFDIFGNQALNLACHYGRLEVVTHLLEFDKKLGYIDVHHWEDLCFRNACDQQHYDVVEFLINEYQIEKTEEIARYLLRSASKIPLGLMLARELKSTEKKTVRTKI